MLEPAQLFGLGSIPFIIGMVELVKRTVPELDKRWWPILGLAFGVIINLALAHYLQASYGLAAILGCVAGLSASGLYSSSKAATE